jgi:hypothetical protein
MSQTDAYNEWFAATFHANVKAPAAIIATSWYPNSKWGQAAHNALQRVEVERVEDLIYEIRDREIPGHFAEFGVFEGWWIAKLCEITERAGLKRNVYGFDSFKGLSNPHPEFDGSYWKQGQHACDLEKVQLNVKASRRSRTKLIDGFFSDSLKREDVATIERFAFVRIDCDLYEPALECLRYIGSRLANDAILVFDDWPHCLGYGEQRAFMDWLPFVPHLQSEFLSYNTWGHSYLKAHHKRILRHEPTASA